MREGALKRSERYWSTLKRGGRSRWPNADHPWRRVERKGWGFGFWVHRGL